MLSKLFSIIRFQFSFDNLLIQIATFNNNLSFTSYLYIYAYEGERKTEQFRFLFYKLIKKYRPEICLRGIVVR